MRPPITSIETFHRLLAACRLPRVIVTAPELSLFTAMGSGSWSIQKLAQALDVSERGVDILCRNLAMCGIDMEHIGIPHYIILTRLAPHP